MSDTQHASLPYELKGYGTKRLEKLGKTALADLCRARSICIPRDSTCESLTELLLEWRREHSSEKDNVCRGDVSSGAPPVTVHDTPHTSLPYDLKGFGAKRLEKLGKTALADLCRARSICIPRDSTCESLTELLLEWRRTYPTSPGPATELAPTVSPLADQPRLRKDAPQIHPTNAPIGRESSSLNIVCHNIQKLTVNCTCNGRNVLEERIDLLARCYENSAYGFPDILVIQEGQPGAEPLPQLSAAMTDKAKRPSRTYAFHSTACIGKPAESMCFVFDTQKVELLGCEIGIPISPSSRFIKTGQAQPLPESFASLIGFDAEELARHTYLSGGQIDPLFLRQPAYALFRLASGVRVLICSVHLNSDPTIELQYTGQLLHSDPQRLFEEQGILSVLCGDMNLTTCRNVERQERPIHDQNEGKWSFGLPPPFKKYTTNLGVDYLAESSSNQCFDNFLVPTFANSWRGTYTLILAPPPGFINFLNAKRDEIQAEGHLERIDTRSRKGSIAYLASNYFSDHVPIQLTLELPHF